MRAPGMFWAAPGFDAQSNLFAVNDILRKLYPLDSSHIYTWTRTAGLVWTVGEAAVAAGLPALVSTTNLFNDGGRIWPIRARERMLVNTLTAGVLVGDFMAPANAGQRALRFAGLPQPLISSITRGAAPSGTLPLNVLVGYSTLLMRSFSDGYSVVSVPSPIYKYSDTNLLTNPVLRVSWNINAGVLLGDVVELYRTDGLPTADVNADPGDTLKRIIAYTLTAPDIANGFVDLTDQTTLIAPLYQTTGLEMYTNPFQETYLQANRQPEVNNAQAVFKGYAFYADLTERAKWTFSVPAGFGTTGNVGLGTDYWRTNGIGTRLGAGTITNGSPVITAVSASDILGIKIGQKWVGGVQFTTLNTVIGVGVNTITMSANATSGGAAFALADQILFNALVTARVAEFGDMINSFGQGIGTTFEVTSDAASPAPAMGATTRGATVSLEPTRQALFNSFVVAATNGANYQPPVPEFNATGKTFTATQTKNLLRWSKAQQPEHVPAANEDEIGFAQIISMAATKNALWIFCTDGLYRLSGDVPPWRVELFDPACILCAPQALCQMRDSIWAYTNYGIVRIDDSGITEITAKTLNEVFSGPPYAENPHIIVERNETDDEIVVQLNAGSNLFYCFNTKQGGWSTITSTPNTQTITAMAFQRSATSGRQRLLVGTSVSGAAPAYSTWDVLGINFLVPTVIYQPFYADDPLVMKQWIDVTYMFDALDGTPGVTQKTISAIQAGSVVASTPITLHTGEAYGTIGITRATAIALANIPGYTHIAYSSQSRFKGLSVRYVPVSNQAWRT